MRACASPKSEHGFAVCYPWRPLDSCKSVSMGGFPRNRDGLGCGWPWEGMARTHVRGYGFLGCRPITGRAVSISWIIPRSSIRIGAIESPDGTYETDDALSSLNGGFLPTASR